MPGNCKFIEALKAAMLFIIVAPCLFAYALRYHSGLNGVFSIVEVLFLRSDTQWLFSIYLGIWCVSFLSLSFKLKDISLIGLLLIAESVYFASYASQSANAVILLAGVTLGKGTRFLLNQSYQFCFIFGLILLLAMASWCHLDMADGLYYGPRWMGLWGNPNDYGMLMSSGLLLATGLLAISLKFKAQVPKLIGNTAFRLLPIILIVATFMMAVGLFLSYSRGAWLGTAVGLLYLAKVYQKFKWKYVLPAIFIPVIVVKIFWNATSDIGPWYVKRMDFSRPSAQHRVAAWKAGFEIMRDHPFGVGWNKTVEIYQKNYSPPENAVGAITTNDYLMLGTQLGIPALVFFMVYVALQLGIGERTSESQSIENPEFGIKKACGAAVLAMLVEFWFDGGLFKLATASVFWIMLELGSWSCPDCVDRE